jgi:hypothetical protein
MVERHDENVVPLDRLRGELAQATEAKSIPRLQRVIGAATIAARAQHKVAELAAGEGSPLEVVEAARAADNDAGGVRLAAESEVGRILQEMKEQGQISSGRQPDPEEPDPRSNSPRSTIPEILGGGPAGSYRRAARMEKIANVPDNIRVEYVDKVREEGGEVTTAGLLRYAAGPKEQQPTERDDMEVAYDEAVRACNQLLRFDAKAIAAHATSTRRRTQFRKLTERLTDWVDQTNSILD